MKMVLERLLEEHILDGAAAERLPALVAEGKPLEDAAVTLGASEEKLLRLLAEIFEVPFIELEQSNVSKEFLAQFPARLLVQHRILPLEERDGLVVVATSRISDTAGLDELRISSG